MKNLLEIISQPDNIAIIIMLVSTILCALVAFREIRINDRFIQSGKKEKIYERMARVLLLVLFVSFETSCTPATIASNLTAGIFKIGAPVFEMESDIETAEVAGLAMIKTLEVFNFQNPKNKIYLNLLAKSYGTYAFGFLENRMLQYQHKDPERYQHYFNRARHFYSTGKNFGMDLLRRKDKKLVRALSEGVDAVRKRMASYERHEIEAVFWTSFNWGSWINLSKDDITAVADLVLVEAMMARILQVSPGFYYGGPHLFYGVYYASRPAMLGGNPEKARNHFEEAAKVTNGRFLMAYALEAQFLAVQTMDQSLFDQMIGKVNEGMVNALPEQRLANALAKERVKFLRDNQNHYF